jgi:hypothetical protein
MVGDGKGEVRLRAAKMFEVRNRSMQHVVLARYAAGVVVSAAKQNASSDADHLRM